MPINYAAIPPHPGIRSSPTSYYLPATKTAGTGTGALTGDRIYYLPFLLPGVTVDRIGIETTTGAGNARLGIYTNVGGLPANLLVDGGQLDISSNAVLESTITALTLPDDWVWVCAAVSSTPTVRTATAAGSGIIGTSSPSSSSTGLIANHTFGALTASAPVASLALLAGVPCLWLRKS